MGDVLVKQNLYALVAKNPAAAGSPITERDFAVDPAEQLSLTDYSQDAGARFSVPASGSLTLDLESLTLASILYIRVEADCGLVITNSLGDSPVLKLKAGRTSALHCEFTALQLVNATATAVKGRFIAVGV